MLLGRMAWRLASGSQHSHVVRHGKQMSTGWASHDYSMPDHSESTAPGSVATFVYVELSIKVCMQYVRLIVWLDI